MRHFFTFLCLLTLGWLSPLATAWAQVVTVSPTFFQATDQVTVTFDATQGNQALQGFTGNVYIWTGVVTNQSTSNTNWRHVHGTNFNAADPTALMTRSLSNPNLYTITFTPQTFYPNLGTETVLRLAMLFKDAAGNVVGRAADGGDIFVDAWQGQFAVRFTQPASGGNPQFVAAGATVNLTGAASSAAQLAISLNGNLIAPAQPGVTSISLPVNITQPGRNVVRLTGFSGLNSASDSLVFIVRPTVTVAPLPAGVPTGLEDGVTYLSQTSAVLVLTAPQKQYVYVLGEWNNFQPETNAYMNQTPDGNRWWVQLNNLVPGQKYAYQYLIDGSLRVADPYAEEVLDPNNDRFIPATTYPSLPAYPVGKTTGIVSVLQTNQPTYTWTTTGYQRPKQTDLVVYELLVRDFIAKHDYQTLRDTLDYLQRLGVNAIELMPVNEFEGNDSWGYNGSFHLALDKYYGTRQAYREFIDECHARGIAVVMDIALNHAFGQNPMVQMYWDAANQRPAASSPWFNPIAKHDFNVGYDFNHESTFTKYYSKRVMRFWLEQFHIDGFRFDLSKGFTQRNTLGNTAAWGQYDQSRINIWKDYADHIWGVDSTAYIILEHFADNSEEKVLAEYRRGMMPWGNANYAFNQASMGYPSGSDFTGGISYKSRGWLKPHLVGYAESHDEQRLMYNNLQNGNNTQAANGYNVRTLATALRRQEPVAAFLLATPGPKMIWQFGEVGYEVDINQNGRTGAKPIRWQYYQQPERRRLYSVYQAMAKLRQHPAFESSNFSWIGQGSSLKTLRIVDPTMSVVVVANFSVVAQNPVVQFPQTGTWYDYFTGDSISFTANPNIALTPGDYHVYTTVRQSLPAGIVLGLKDEVTADKAGLTAPQAFPNPSAAGQGFTLAYELVRPAAVQATVLDVLGREVARVSAPLQPAGFQTLELTTPLAPGTYLVRVQPTGGVARTTRVVVR